MLKYPLRVKYLIFACLAVILFWSCNADSTYKVRRLHNGHTRIAYSFGKRDLAISKDTALTVFEKSAKVEIGPEIYPQTDTTPAFIDEVKSDPSVSNFHVLDSVASHTKKEESNVEPSSKASGFEFQKSMEPQKSITQENESMWSYIFGGFWSFLAALFIILVVLIIIGTIVYYGAILISALSVSGAWWKVLLVLGFIGLLLYAEYSQ